ncbi:FliM/FliN family flagellar motor switch protein, partial [Paracoccus liaowanqingii]
PAAPAPPPPSPRPTLAAAMQDAPVQLSAILCRRRISLAELRGLTQGRLLTLPRNSLAQATLETADGQVLATGKFGEAEGCHALRLRDPAQPLAGDEADFPARHAPGDLDGMPGVAPPQDLARPDPFRETGAGAPVVSFPAMTGLTMLGG